MAHKAFKVWSCDTSGSLPTFQNGNGYMKAKKKKKSTSKIFFLNLFLTLVVTLTFPMTWGLEKVELHKEIRELMLIWEVGQYPSGLNQKKACGP